jgi:hypothetical protein
VALIVPPGFAQAAFIFGTEVGTGPIVTTLGVSLENAGGDFVEAANQIKQHYADAFGTVTSNALTLDRVSLYVGSDGPSGSVDSDTPPIAMSNTGVYGPIAMSAILRKVSQDPGRRGRGRMFLPGSAPEANVEEDGSLNSAQRAAITTAAQAFFTDMTTTIVPAGPFPPVILHSQAPADPSPLTGFAVSDLVGWIRGRIR